MHEKRCSKISTVRAKTPPKNNQQPRLIIHAIQGNTEKIRELFTIGDVSTILQQTVPQTNATAYHMAAYNGHLDALKCLVHCGGKTDLLKVDNEGSSVLDVALDSKRPSATIFNYLLFEVAVPFNNRTLILLNKKHTIFVEKINETYPSDQAIQLVKQLYNLLKCAGQPEWELKRRAAFARPRLSSLAAMTASLIKSMNLDPSKLNIPEEVRKQITNSPCSLKELAAFALKNKVPAELIKYKGLSLIFKSKVIELPTDRMAIGCSNAIEKALQL